MMVYIYCLKCPDTNNVRYVGKTINSLERRLNKHMAESSLAAQNNHRTNWLRSLKNENKMPIIELLEIVAENTKWEDRERAWIALFKKNGAKLINSNDGGDGQHGRILSQQTKNKISKSLMGHSVSEETRNKKRLKKLGSIWSEESKAKISRLHKGRKRPKETGAKISKALKGIKRSEEFKKRISQRQLGRIATNKKEIEQFNKNMNKIKRYTSITEASRETNISHSAIINCLKGLSKSSGGYVWKYV